MPELSNGSAVSRGSFKKRASSIKSNAGLFQLVEDMASSLDEMRGDVAIIKQAVLAMLETRRAE